MKGCLVSIIEHLALAILFKLAKVIWHKLFPQEEVPVQDPNRAPRPTAQPTPADEDAPARPWLLPVLCLVGAVAAYLVIEFALGGFNRPNRLIAGSVQRYALDLVVGALVVLVISLWVRVHQLEAIVRPRPQRPVQPRRDDEI